MRNKKIEELEARLTKLVDNPYVQKALEQEQIEKEKLAAYEQLVKSPFKYEIIKDFVNAAAQGVVVKFVVDGIPIEIRRDEAPVKNKFSSDLF